MSATPLSILGIGLDLPPAVSVREYAASKGADVSSYRAWSNVCHVRNDEDQPSTMGARALAAALAQCGVATQELRLVIFAGVSRDYPPSWSVATEVMRLSGMSGDDCVGLDLTIGCLGTLSALDLVQGWLALRGGGHAAIVAAERWSHTIDHSNPALAGLWANGDAGAALVVGLGSARTSIAEFLGAEFTSLSEQNGYVLIPYGGTRIPTAPPGVDPFARTLAKRDPRQMRDEYVRGYGQAYEALTRRVGRRGERLVCNQLTPNVVKLIAKRFGIAIDKTVVTGDDTGHLGACDVIVGLARLSERGEIDAPIAIGSSTPYAFGAGLLAPPATFAS